jgi:hypothetical protein
LHLAVAASRELLVVGRLALAVHRQAVDGGLEAAAPGGAYGAVAHRRGWLAEVGGSAETGTLITGAPCGGGATLARTFFNAEALRLRVHFLLALLSAVVS